MGAKLTVFLGYLVVIIGVGIWGYLNSKDMEDYFLGGRGLGTWVVAISTKASDMSGWLLLGVPGIAYVYGISSFWILVSTCFWDSILWFFVSKRLRRYSGLLDSLTMPEFFSDRLKDDKRIIQGIAGLVILFFMTAYVSSQLTAGGKAISSGFEIGYTPALIIAVVLTVGYTLAGGFLSVSHTDVLQGIMMIIALVMVPVVGLITIGGWSELVQGLAQATPAADYNLLSVTGGTAGQAFFIGLLISVFFTASYGEPGIPHVVIRFMGARDTKKMRHSALIGIFWVVISMFGALMVGLVARVYTLQAGGLADPEKSLPHLADALMHPWIAGFILAAIIAATMSTADSQLLVAASSLIRDVLERWFNLSIPDNKRLTYSRITVLIVVVAAFIIARIPGVIFFLVAFAWSGMATAFAPLMIASLYWKKLTKPGAIASILSAFVTCIIWNFTPALQNFIHFQFPAMIVSIVVLIVVSLNTQPPVGVEEEMDAVISGKQTMEGKSDITM